MTALWFWLIAFAVVGLGFTVLKSFFLARKIQPNGFKWKTFRNEAFFGVINIAASAVLLGGTTAFLTANGFIHFNEAPAAWWVIALEYVAYFILFDTYFYWFHRLMHWKPIYPWVHQIHHFSISPNPLTTLSVNPLESLINGGFVPLFLASAALVALPIHEQTMAFIGPTNIIMGIYVHMGFEFFPRWWNKSWATKWFITSTFHDQHHRWFNCNYGGYTTVWDRLCGTMRPKFEADYDALCARRDARKTPAAPEAVAAE